MWVEWAILCEFQWKFMLNSGKWGNPAVVLKTNDGKSDKLLHCVINSIKFLSTPNDFLLFKFISWLHLNVESHATRLVNLLYFLLCFVSISSATKCTHTCTRNSTNCPNDRSSHSSPSSLYRVYLCVSTWLKNSSIFHDLSVFFKVDYKQFSLEPEKVHS